MRTPVADLDQDTRDYLQTVWQTQGSGANGVYIPRSGGALVGWILLGLLCLGVAALLCFVANSSPATPYWQAGLVAAGVLLVAWSMQRVRARRRHARLGSFWFFDSLYFWDVTPDRVRATPIDQISSARGTNFYQNWVYTHSDLELTTPATVLRPRLTSVSQAEELMGFLNALIALRDAAGNEWLRNDPGMLAALAASLARGQTSVQGEDLRPCPIPRPVATSPAAAARRLLVPVVAAAAAFAGAVLAFPPVDRLLHERELFGRIPVQDRGSVKEMNDYLAAFPTGWRSAEVLVRRDDLLFQKARQQAELNNSPGGLRAYLADERNVRHRKEAQRMVNVSYDKAIARLKSLPTRPTLGEAKMFDGLLALLEGLKTARRPVVTVGFRGTYDELPKTAAQQKAEQFEADLRARENAQVKAMAESSPTKSAIMGAGATFAPPQAEARERVILERLKDALHQALGADVLTLERAAPGEQPAIEVAYHIFAPGNLYLYTTSNNPPGFAMPGGMPGGPPGNRFNFGGPQTVKGLLRSYWIDWTITVRAPNGASEVFRVPSQPAQKLTYDARPGDPEWAPYAILLYSGFYDMSTRLIREFGLSPQQPPTHFTFAQATGSASR
jgi:hypothetical protein